MAMTEDVIEKLEKAGAAVAQALERALDIVQEGASIRKACQDLENVVLKQGAKPAFPVNISINEVAAHYTAPPTDDPLIPPRSVVKVDIGAHVDGYIADAAITIALDPEHLPLVKAAYDALKVALSTLKHGVSLRLVGAAVERCILANGYVPIRNLTGHKIERYNLHAGKSVPNVAVWSLARAEEGEIYAVEPFVTDGEGVVVEGGYGNIFRIISTRRTGYRELDEFLRALWKEYRSLPFASRWVYAKWGLRGLEKLEELVRKKRIYHYPVLVERSKGLVSQFEDTVIVTREGTKPLVGTLSIVKY